MLGHVQLFATPSMGFTRREYWNGLPFPPPGDLPDPGFEPESLASPALATRYSTTEPPGKLLSNYKYPSKLENFASG